MVEGALDGDVVVDALEEDSLAAERDAMVRQPDERFFGFACEFAGMVDMDGEEQGCVFAQSGAEGVRDALREEDRNARANAQEFDMRNAAEFGEDGIQPRVGEEKGVSAGKEHIADFLMAADVIEGGIPVRAQFMVRDAGDDARACAVAAIGGAAVCGQQENAVRVTVDEAGGYHATVFAAGVGHFFFPDNGFIHVRDDLPPQRVAWIVGIDQAQEIGGDADGQPLGGMEQGVSFFGAEAEGRFQLGDRVEAVPELPCIVFPFFLCGTLSYGVGNIGQESLLVHGDDGKRLVQVLCGSEQVLRSKTVWNGCMAKEVVGRWKPGDVFGCGSDQP